MQEGYSRSPQNRRKDKSGAKTRRAHSHKQCLFPRRRNDNENRHAIRRDSGSANTGDRPSGDQRSTRRRAAADDASHEEDDRKEKVNEIQRKDGSQFSCQRRHGAGGESVGGRVPGDLRSVVEFRGDRRDRLVMY